MSALPVLWQFRQSHYNDKVRWALDWKRLPHRRRSVVPGLHVPRIMWLTGQRSVPVLVLGGTAITDSTRIIEVLERLHPDPPLYPRDDAAQRRALELEEFFDEELGPHLRRAWFHELLPDADFSSALLAGGTSPLVQRLYRALFPVVRQVMTVDMGIDAAGAERSRITMERALDRLEAEIGDSGYLVGDGFTVADLTAAALLYPIVLPPEFPYPIPAPLPTRAARFRDSLRGRRGFEWAAEMYRRHRGTSAEVSAQ